MGKNADGRGSVMTVAHMYSFFHMGGYAAYVWFAYGFVLFFLIFYGLRALFQLKRLMKKSELTFPLKTELLDDEVSWKAK